MCDISYDEAVAIHTKFLQRSCPTTGFTEETVRETLDSNEKYFLTERGEVSTYDNSERADIFDIRYIEGKESWEKLQIEKDNFIKAHKIMPFEDIYYRIYPELIKD